MLHSRNTLWNPWHELMDFDRVFSPLFGSTAGRHDFPPANVWTSNDKLVFTFELPGVKADDLEISAKADTLTVKGSRKPDVLPEGAQYVRQERGSGSFTRSFALPFKIDQDAVEASYINGVLTITLPKAPEVQPRKIAIAAN